jgi:chromosome segregation protein
MLLDEAFYGVDDQNTFATAEFLKSLGLQLVMAAPDNDRSKLLSLVDSYYELSRYGTDVFPEHVVVKEPARKLMQSDMPVRNPELLQRALEGLQERERAA